jgi:hypothetical protein
MHNGSNTLCSNGIVLMIFFSELDQILFKTSLYVFSFSMAKLNEQEECHGTPLVASYTYSNTRIGDDDNCERFLSVLLTFIANLKQIKSCCTFFLTS